jgi:flagellar biosynthetic protein FliQ
MTPETVLSLGKQALELTVMLAAPMLIASLAVGLLIGIFQAATQINEMTLSFIPKLIILVIVLLISGPWMLETMVSYVQELFLRIPELIG